MASRHRLLGHRLPGIRLQVSRSDQYCASILALSTCSHAYLVLIALQSNAYVSGMQEDLHLYGNELNYFTTYFK